MQNRSFPHIRPYRICCFVLLSMLLAVSMLGCSLNSSLDALLSASADYAASGSSSSTKAVEPWLTRAEWESVWSDFILSDQIASVTYWDPGREHPSAHMGLADINGDGVPELLVSYTIDNAYCDYYLLVYQIRRDLKVEMVSHIDSGTSNWTGFYEDHGNSAVFCSMDQVRAMLTDDEYEDPFEPALHGIPYTQDLIPYRHTRTGEIVFVDAVSQEGHWNFKHGILIYGADRNGNPALIDSFVARMRPVEESSARTRVFDCYWQSWDDPEDWQWELWCGVRNEKGISGYSADWIGTENVGLETYVQRLQAFAKTYEPLPASIQWLEVHDFTELSPGDVSAVVRGFGGSSAASSSTLNLGGIDLSPAHTGADLAAIYPERGTYTVGGRYTNPYTPMFCEKIAETLIPEHGIATVTQSSDTFSITEGLIAIHMADLDLDECPEIFAIVAEKPFAGSRADLAINLYLYIGEGDYFYLLDEKPIPLYELREDSFHSIDIVFSETASQGIIIARGFSGGYGSLDSYAAYTIRRENIADVSLSELLDLSYKQSEENTYVRCFAGPNSLMNKGVRTGDDALDKNGSTLFFKDGPADLDGPHISDGFSSAEDAVEGAFAEIGIAMQYGNPWQTVPNAYAGSGAATEVVLRVSGWFE